MSVIDLFKATIVCGSIGFLVYSFPIIAQVVILGALGLAWFSYAQKALRMLIGR